jgi:hypothetical protein
MAKTKVSEFDAVASNNTDINSVNVAEGCPPSGINNAIREMASLLKKQEVGTDAMTSPDIDGGTIDGATIGGSSGVTIGVSDGTVSAPSIKFTSDTNTGIYRGGTDILKFVTAGTDAITIDASQNVDGTVTADGLTVSTDSYRQCLHRCFYIKADGRMVDDAGSIGFRVGITGATFNRLGVTGAGECVIYTPDNSNIIFGTNNSQRMRIDSSGNVGIGVTPEAWDSAFSALQVGGTGALRSDASADASDTVGVSQNAYYDSANSRWEYLVTDEASDYYQQSGSHNWRVAPSGSADSAITWTTAMSIANSGNVGIGTSSPDYNLQVEDTSSNISLALTSSTSGFSRVIFGDSGSATIGAVTYRNSDNSMAFEANAAEAMRITSGGDLLVNTTTDTSGGFSIQTISSNTTATRMLAHGFSCRNNWGTATNLGNGIFSPAGGTLAFSTSSVERMRIDSSGNLLVGRTDNPSGVSNCIYALGNYGVTTGSGANVFINSEGLLFRSTSSLRYKNTIEDATHGLTELLTLRPVTYKAKNGKDTIFGGLIAEEVHDAGLTEFVQYNDDGEPDALAYGNMVSLCIKAIQELKAELDSAKARITALENGE